MKKVFFSLLAITFSAGMQTFAQDQVIPVTANASPSATINAELPKASSAAQDNKSQIAVDSLPEAIKKTLATDKYKDWTVVSAWLVKGEVTHYELQMKKGEETTSLKFDANGNAIS